MSLPKVPSRTKELTLAPGVTITVRGLTRTEARHLTTAFKNDTPEGDVDGAEIWLISTSLGVSEAEAALWREQTDSEVVDDVSNAIINLSGLSQKDADGKVIDDPKPDTSAPSSQASSTPTITSLRSA